MSIALENLTVSYQRRPAIHHLTGEFADQQATAICGPNGAGKSTLLKAIVGIIPLDEGAIHWGNIRRKDMAYLPQQSEIDRSLPMNIIDLVMTGLWNEVGISKAINRQAQEQALAALEQVGLADYAFHSIASVSNGQFQRVLFARIIVQNAKLIFLDEPFNAVDAYTTEELLALIERWKHEKRTVIAVLHNNEQVSRHFPYTLLLAREVIAWGASAQVITEAHLAQAHQKMAHWDESLVLCQQSRTEKR